MRYALLHQAVREVPNPDVLINLVSKRVKQLRNGADPLVDSLERLTFEDVALREIIEHKIAANI